MSVSNERNIQVVGTMERVRQRPGMYVGYLDDPTGVETLVRELIENSLDQCLGEQATYIRVTTDERCFCVEDDGEGLPFDVEYDGSSLAQHYLTKLRFSPSADAHSPHIHLGPHLGGLPIVNALSMSFELWSWRAGERWHQRYERGIPTASAQVVERAEGARGTKILVHPDPEIFNEHTAPRPTQLRALCERVSWMFPGTRLELDGVRHYNPEGLVGFATKQHAVTLSASGNPRLKSWRLREDDFSVELVCAQEQASQTQWRSWVNGAPSPGHGSHVEGAQRAFNHLGLSPAWAMIHIIAYSPRWAGPVREQLVVPELVEPLAASIIAHA